MESKARPMSAQWVVLRIGSIGCQSGPRMPSANAVAQVEFRLRRLVQLALFGVAVRHPTYARPGQWRGKLGVAITTVAPWRKLRLGEAKMRQQSSDAFPCHARYGPELVPFAL
jgi:hypothetical protein